MVASLAMMMTNLLQTTSWKRFYQQTYFPVRIVLLTRKPGYNSLRRNQFPTWTGWKRHLP
jgi:hypothetical protein